MSAPVICSKCAAVMWDTEAYEMHYCPGMDGEKHDSVNRPAHYVACGIPECIEIIEALSPQWLAAGLNPLHLGNALKYLYRAGAKGDPIEQVAKAEWYCRRAKEHPLVLPIQPEKKP